MKHYLDRMLFAVLGWVAAFIVVTIAHPPHAAEVPIVVSKTDAPNGAVAIECAMSEACHITIPPSENGAALLPPCDIDDVKDPVCWRAAPKVAVKGLMN